MIKRGIIFLFLVILFLRITSASLGISPATKDLNFVPNGEYEYTFNIVTDNSEGELDIYLDGDLAQYARLSKTTARGSESFKVTITFQDKIERPGIHGLTVGVKERPSENEFIGTVIDIGATIRIFVPYPGKYIEGDFNVLDGNIDENVPVELKLTNRGKESLNVGVEIRFFSGGGELIYTMPFEPAQLNVSGERYFRKYLNTSGYRPGEYLAEAVVDYGDLFFANKSFRVGSLNVEISNFTEKLASKDIQKFSVDVESKWNNPLEEIYAEVNVSNFTWSTIFRTPSVDLSPWEKKTLVGFLDTNFMEGEYSTNISLSYLRVHTYALGTLLVYKMPNLWLIIGIIAAAILVIAGIIWMLRKNKRSIKWTK